ncbi:MAG: amylo-alpha-1,6-glucosidase [Terriglobia bacterium]
MNHSQGSKGFGRSFLLLLASIVTLCFSTPAVRGAQGATEIETLFKQHGFKQTIVKPASGILKHPYLVPSGPYFQLFDWDMYFMGVALSHDSVGRPLASSVEDFLEFVDATANVPGYTAREIAPDALWALPEMCKPFLAQAAVRASETTGDYQWVAPYYKRLMETISFWENTRQSPDGLFRWYNGVESGVDNNPAVSDRPAVTTEGVDLACYIFREYQAMAIIAEKLGKPQDAAGYRTKAATLAGRIRKQMWLEPDGLFFNVDSRTGRFIRVKTWTDFVPLWAGVATPHQAGRMIREHLLNPAEFWAPYGVRTLAPGEPLYDPDHGYWRGPVWIISNYLLMHGLMNYGYRPQAIELASKTVRLLVDDLKKTGGMNECYNPQTGAPTAGGNFLSWDLLAEHMLEEAQSNSDPTALR